ncbi:MAG: hypothetical protein M1829_006197 [Trizodia sp. TS-e1964]|nr:MAG: hypothetical protein M1829_006197 [Trizodia sp. TS-e1964]
MEPIYAAQALRALNKQLSAAFEADMSNSPIREDGLFNAYNSARAKIAMAAEGSGSHFDAYSALVKLKLALDNSPGSNTQLKAIVDKAVEG